MRAGRAEEPGPTDSAGGPHRERPGPDIESAGPPDTGERRESAGPDAN